jgi:hypothetical protein
MLKSMKSFGRKNQEKRLLPNRAEKKDSGSHLRHGLLMANVGLLLIIFSEWDALREGWDALLYIGGGMLCVAGIILIWIGVLNFAALGECLPRAWGTNHPGKHGKTSLAGNDLKTMAGLAKVSEQSRSHN